MPPVVVVAHEASGEDRPTTEMAGGTSRTALPTSGTVVSSDQVNSVRQARVEGVDHPQRLGGSVRVEQRRSRQRLLERIREAGAVVRRGIPAGRCDHLVPRQPVVVGLRPFIADGVPVAGGAGVEGPESSV